MQRHSPAAATASRGLQGPTELSVRNTPRKVTLVFRSRDSWSWLRPTNTNTLRLAAARPRPYSKWPLMKGAVASRRTSAWMPGLLVALNSSCRAPGLRVRLACWECHHIVALNSSCRAPGLSVRLACWGCRQIVALNSSCGGDHGLPGMQLVCQKAPDTMAAPAADPSLQRMQLSCWRHWAAGGLEQLLRGGMRCWERSLRGECGFTLWMCLASLWADQELLRTRLAYWGRLTAVLAKLPLWFPSSLACRPVHGEP